MARSFLVASQKPLVSTKALKEVGGQFSGPLPTVQHEPNDTLRQLISGVLQEHSEEQA